MLSDCSLSWICIATILSSSLSIIVFLTSLTASKSQRDSAGGKHPSGALRRPSTYVNLEKALIEPDHIFPPISNFPQVVYQISTSDPLRQMAENTTRSWRAKVGIVYPDARRIFITNEVCIVVIYFFAWYFLTPLCILRPLPYCSFDMLTSGWKTVHLDSQYLL